MDRIFITVLNMGMSASFCILAVMLLRLLLRSAPKIFSYLLWAVVLVRLVCPVLPEAGFGLVPDIKVYGEMAPVHKETRYTAYLMKKIGQYSLSVLGQERQNAGDGAENGNYAIGEAYGGAVPENGTDIWEANLPEEGRVNHIPEEKFSLDDSFHYPYGWGIHVLAIGWALAVFVLWAYAAMGYGIFMHGIAGKKVSAPFVAGLLRPVIYLPEDLDDIQGQMVWEHERVHIRRLDYLVKPAAFLVCCVHWFNPLVWVSFFLMERDMESSCDEAVVRKFGYDKRKDYANALLGLSQSRGWRAGYPIAFGENHVKSRIKGVVKMKKTGTGAMTGAGVLVLAATVLLLVNSSERDRAVSVMAEDLDNGVTANSAGEAAASSVQGEEMIDLPREQASPPTSGPEVREYGETFRAPDGEYEYLPKADIQGDIPVSEGGGQETVMNYDPNRARDQYEVILLPQTDEAVDDFRILFSYPVEGARISDGFGSRVHPVSGDVRYHLGVDFAAEEGTPVRAAADGIVVKTGYDADCGNYLILLHENGEATYYCQCRELMAEEGTEVKRGEQIAELGNTGKSTGAHLHFAVSWDGAYIEPEFAEDQSSNPPG